MDTVQDTKFSNWLRTRHHVVQDMVIMLMQLFLNTLFPLLADFFAFLCAKSTTAVMLNLGLK